MSKFTVNTHHAYLNNDIVLRCDGSISIEDKETGKTYSFKDELMIHLTAGHHTLLSEDHKEEILIEDAIKMGGSKIKDAFIFDNNPWIFVTTKDRLYINNRETDVELVEYNITPDKIEQLSSTCSSFLFITDRDYAIYNVLSGNVFRFTKHIYSNSHLVIYETNNGVTVYDHNKGKVVLNFDGSRYSIAGRKLYYIDDKKLYWLHLYSLINKPIDFVGEIEEDDILIDNCLLRFHEDNPDHKKYLLFTLNNVDNKKTITELIFPYYINKWKNGKTNTFKRAKENYKKFEEENKPIISKYPDVSHLCFGIDIIQEITNKDLGKNSITLSGNIISYPAMMPEIPFVLQGIEGDTLDFDNASLSQLTIVDETENKDDSILVECLNKGERILTKSVSGEWLIIESKPNLILWNYKDNTRKVILKNSFDSSYYHNAYFTSDGKDVILQINETEGKLLGIDDLQTTKFEVDGFTVARNEGFNGYKPEISISGGRKPVWRDPVTLDYVPEEELSSHIFMSPDRRYTASINLNWVYFNRITKSEISINELRILQIKYDWSQDAKKEEKKAKIELRKELVSSCDENAIFGKIIEKYRTESYIYHRNEDKLQNRLIKKEIDIIVNEKLEFTSLFIDTLHYVQYWKNDDKSLKKSILIGRNVYFLNYVSFSYDSKYLSIAAKMNQDEFRQSQEGVFVLYDIEKEEVVNRVERYQNVQLWAVWMTLFSKKGDVAFYEGRSNAYLLKPESNYQEIVKANGKSLLCFSPSGNYIALSDQNYIDYTHHPNSNWGHQPSGNVFIHATNDFENCLEQYNDLGESIEGVSSRARNVASAAFSQDDKRLLVVGNDGVVVVRNLKHTVDDNDKVSSHNIFEDLDNYQNDHSTNYIDENLVHYSKDKKILFGPQEDWCFGKVYIIPEGTEVIYHNAFQRNEYTHFFQRDWLETIVIPTSTRVIGYNAISGKYKVICRSPHFIWYKNGLYTSDFKRLVYYPFLKGTHEIFTHPNTEVISFGLYDNSETGHPESNYRWQWSYYPTSVLHLYSTNCKIDLPQKTILCVPKGTTELFVKQGYDMAQIIEDTVFIDIYGAIYTNDKKILLAFPFGSSLEEYCVVDTCETIKDNAFKKELYAIDEDYSEHYVGNRLKSVTFPESLLNIGNSAFEHCDFLESIVIPQNLSNIGENSFLGCTNLISIIVDERNVTYDSRDNCNAIIETSVNKLILGCMSTVIPEGVTIIGKQAFMECNISDTILIPNSVKIIEDDAFLGCKHLLHISIPTGITAIGDKAFWGCERIKTITISNSVKHIGNNILGNCMDLSSIIVCAGNTTYDSRDNCNAIIETKTNTLIVGCSSSKIPKSIVKIGESSFEKCEYLTSVIIPDGVVEVGNKAFYWCEGLEYVSMPNSIKIIGESAFEDCCNLTSVVIPDGVVEIGNKAFFGCSKMKSIYLPNSINKIGEMAFSSLDSFSSILVAEDSKEKFERLLPKSLHGVIVEKKEGYKKIDPN